MATAKARLRTEPSEVILDLAAHQPKALVTLHNPASHCVAFKVKTTDPDRYFIVLQKQARDALVAAPPQDCKDRFLVASVVIDADLYSKITSKREKISEANEVFSELWKVRAKEELSNKRIGCKFQYPGADPPSIKREDSPVNQAPPPQPILMAQTPAKAPSSKGLLGSSAASPNLTPPPALTKPVVLATPAATLPPTGTPRLAPTSSTVMAAIPRVPTMSSAASASAPAAPAQTSAQAQASAQTSVAAPAPVPTPAGEESWQVKYKNLLKVIVQVTDERDGIRANFRAVNRELLALKETKSGIKSTNSANGDLGTVSQSETGLRMLTRQSFALWHLILVALGAFLVARITMLMD